MSRQARRQFIEQRVNVRAARILEIGAMDSPTFPERDPIYLDWFSHEELEASLAGNPRRRADRIVDPHYVVKRKRFAADIPERPDLIIANHVVEHIADPITWFQELRALAPKGNLFLSIPDRAFTFDFLRPTSTVADLLRAHAEDLERPSKWQMLESIFYYRPLRADDVWAGDFSKLEHSRYSVKAALKESERAEREYVDIHCYVFTAESFGRLISDLAETIGWRISALGDVAYGSNEFCVWLRPV